MKNTAMQELLEKYGHLLPNIEDEFMEKEKEQLNDMYEKGYKWGYNDCLDSHGLNE